ncbi:MAG: hypothetical protein HGA72_03605 [Chlorobiaceae bacterium]|nr:hypothetical protein [Chlorobiaceae bacterium]NTW64442.1 hypothetical protein [Chlorobiaceae bacterium]
MAINRSFFFDHVRLYLFDGKLKQSQVQGLDAILDYWGNKMEASDDRWLAYALATAHHETDRSMQPIKEYGSTAYFMKMYDCSGGRPLVAKNLGNTHPGDGAKYYGRGYVQLTGRRNYTDWSKRLDLDLAGNPDLALDPAIATRILFEGMQLGTFTGRKFADYFNPQKEDWLNARRIINGTDKANLIEGYGKRYYGGISYTT